MSNSKKIYFISDVHLGLYPEENSRKREKILIEWLDQIKDDVSELYLLGDIFDFWHEYKHVVPRGFTRFLGRLGDLSDKGVKLFFFTGNHDIWAYNYFKTELGAEIHKKPIVRELNGYRFFLGHGDGVGPGDKSYKLLKWFFTNRFLQFLFARLHPNFALWLGKTWSKRSRYAKGIVAEKFNGESGEFQIQFAKQVLKKEHYDFFIFGHRHIPYDIQLQENSRIINLGDWIYSFTYGELDGENFSLKQFKKSKTEIIFKRLGTNS